MYNNLVQYMYSCVYTQMQIYQTKKVHQYPYVAYNIYIYICICVYILIQILAEKYYPQIKKNISQVLPQTVFGSTVNIKHTDTHA